MSGALGNQYPDPASGFMTRTQAKALWDQQGQELM